MREPAVAGQFYSPEKEELEDEIEKCFTGKLGPGLPEEGKKEKVFGAVVPHAGYAYSGQCAAYVYRKIAEAEKPDLFVIIGLSHTGFQSCVSLEDWKTPLGTARNDLEFGKKLMKNADLRTDENAHREEHSIEVQLPFLQHVFKNNFKFLPVIASRDRNHSDLGKNILKTAKELNRKICVLASSDFTHYGFAYQYIPFTANVKENIEKLDRQAIDLILKKDSHGFLNFVFEKSATICGAFPIAVMLESLDKGKGKLLKYYTSGEISRDFRNCVGYSGIVFE